MHWLTLLPCLLVPMTLLEEIFSISEKELLTYFYNETLDSMTKNDFMAHLERKILKEDGDFFFDSLGGNDANGLTKTEVETAYNDMNAQILCHYYDAAHLSFLTHLQIYRNRGSLFGNVSFDAFKFHFAPKYKEYIKHHPED